MPDNTTAPQEGAASLTSDDESLFRSLMSDPVVTTLATPEAAA